MLNENKHEKPVSQRISRWGREMSYMCTINDQLFCQPRLFWGEQDMRTTPNKNLLFVSHEGKAILPCEIYIILAASEII